MELSQVVEVVGKVGPVIVGLATLAGAALWLVKLDRKRRRAVARARSAEKLLDGSEKKRREAEEDCSAAQAIAQNEKERADKIQREEKSLRDNLATAESSLAEANEQIEAQLKALERYEAQIDAVAKQDGRVWCATLAVHPPKFVPLTERHGRRPTIISMLNLKGGVGKTTLTANLGGYLASCRDKWVLLLDLDHQRSLTQTIFTTGKRKDIAAAHRTIQDFLSSDDMEFLRFAEQVVGEGYSRLWAVGASDSVEGFGNTQNLDDLEMDLLGQWLINPSARDIRYLLRTALHSRAVQERYDYVLIDCPPRLTTGCINALAASDYVLIPAQAEHVSASSVSHLLRRLRPLRDEGVIPDLRVLGVVGNMVSEDASDSRSREAKLLEQTSAAASALWGSQVRVLKSMIRDSGQYARYQRDSEGKDRTLLPAVVVGDIRKQYEELANEIEEHIHENLGIARVPS